MITPFVNPLQPSLSSNITFRRAIRCVTTTGWPQCFSISIAIISSPCALFFRSCIATTISSFAISPAFTARLLSGIGGSRAKRSRSSGWLSISLKCLTVSNAFPFLSLMSIPCLFLVPVWSHTIHIVFVSFFCCLCPNPSCLSSSLFNPATNTSSMLPAGLHLFVLDFLF